MIGTANYIILGILIYMACYLLSIILSVAMEGEDNDLPSWYHLTGPLSVTILILICIYGFLGYTFNSIRNRFIKKPERNTYNLDLFDNDELEKIQHQIESDRRTNFQDEIDNMNRELDDIRNRIMNEDDYWSYNIISQTPTIQRSLPEKPKRITKPFIKGTKK